MALKVINSMKKSLKIWWLYTKYTFLQIMTNRTLMLVFLLGKIVRIAMFFMFLLFVFGGTSQIGGYSRNQILFFYLTFNLIDTSAQLLFREAYRFRPLVISGNFDFVLLKPVNPLIRVLLGGTDLMDLIMLVLITGVTFWFGFSNITRDPSLWLIFITLVINSVVFAASFHIFVLGLGIVTLSVDHLVMIYRDLTALLRIPVDLYTEPLRSFLTFVLPLGIMFTFPPKVLMGFLSWPYLIISFLFSLLLLVVNLKFWKYSLQHYQSASS